MDERSGSGAPPLRSSAMTGSHETIIDAAKGFSNKPNFRRNTRRWLRGSVSAGKDDRMNDGDGPGAIRPETTKEKSERLKAARLQAERDKDTRIERATRKAIARRKVLGDGKS